MDTKKIAIGVLLATTAVFAVIAYKNPSVITVPTEIKIDGSTLGNQSAPIVNVPAPVVNVPAPIVNVSVPTQTPSLGAVSSPDIQSSWIRVGGVTRYYSRQNMIAATTTPCAILSPISTSTLLSATWQITVGTSTAATLDIGTSTTAFSTTTNLVAAKSVAANAQGYATWKPVGGSVDDSIMSPSRYVVVKTAGAGLGGYTYTGTCQAVFEVL